MKTLIGIVISVIVSLSILIVVLSMSEEILYEYSEIYIEENFIATKFSHQVEILELEYDVFEVTLLVTDGIVREDPYVYIVDITDNIVSLKTFATDINDPIEIGYTYLSYGYDQSYSDSTISLVEIIPTFILMTIISALAVVIWKMKKA